jgi:hypothetical protein
MFPLILKVSTRWKSVVTFRPISVVPVETVLLTTCMGVSEGDRIGLEVWEKKKNLSFIPGIEPRILGRPAHSMATNTNYGTCVRKGLCDCKLSGKCHIDIDQGSQSNKVLEWLPLNHDEVHWTGVLYRVMNLDFRKSIFLKS